jgi:UDP-N-acetylmuramoylalanine-D-glutamate ligase
MDSSTYGQGYVSSYTSVSSLLLNITASHLTRHPGMVLFYCTAVAMKRQDETGIAEGLEDFFDPGEEIEFSR